MCERSTRTARIARSQVSAVIVVAVCGLALIVVPALAAEGPAPVPVLTDSPLSSAINVDVDSRCSEIRFRSPEAKVVWYVGAAPGLKADAVDALTRASEFRIDFSPYPEGLEIGRFESRLLDRTSAPEQAVVKADGSHTRAHAAVVTELKPGVYYQARVLVKTDDGWVASSSVGFLSSICPVDGIAEDKE